jgi:hypothetical protein
MNERIKQLAEQAKLQLDQDIKDGKKDWKNTPQSYDEMVQEKFAELIVRECLKIVEPTEDSGDEWCVTLKGTAQEIKEHFGVK